MSRMFSTHKVRKQRELSGCLWDFTPKQSEGENKSQKVYVPGCWEMLPGFGNYRGEALYSRTFEAGGNIRLEFKGVSHSAKVFLDGELIGSHYGAYTPFEIVLSGLETKTHNLDVWVDNSFGEHSALHIPNDYMTYGGISRPVVAEELGCAYIKWANYTTFREDGKWFCKASVCIKKVEAVCGNLYAAIEWNGQTITVGDCQMETDDEVVLEKVFEAGNVEPWMPEHPNLYFVTAYLFENQSLIDDLIDRIGFREIRIEKRNIFINGKSIRIKGVCRHEDQAGFGCALPVASMQRDIRMMLDLGVNSVRTTHYPNDERFLDLCDEQGILVWEENHARALSEENMRNPYFEEQCESCNREMVRNHFNHPCIFIWGILNECASETEYGRQCYQKQLDQIRSMDDSRPLTFASCRFKQDSNGKNLEITDICMDLPDIVSYNMYPQWYFDVSVSEFLQEFHDCIDRGAGSGKPMIVSEIGAGAEYGFHSPEHLKWSEEYQADALAQQVKGVLEDPLCCGLYIWQFSDVRVSTEWFAKRPRSHNNKGILDEYRRPKMSYETVKRIFESYGNYFETDI